MSFNDQVFALTRAIPLGKVLNYGAVAELLGKPQGSRAVGYALNSLPYDTDVPWHRVVGKNGIYGKSSIHGAGYGADEQIARLKEEGIGFDAQNQFVLIDYLWQPSPQEIDQILHQVP